MHRHSDRKGVILRSPGAVVYVGTARCNKYVQSCQVLSIVVFKVICLHNDDNAVYECMSSCPIREARLAISTNDGTNNSACTRSELPQLLKGLAWFSLLLVMFNDNVLHSLIEDVAYF